MKISACALAITAALGLGSTGCIKQMILNGQIAGTRQGSAASDTLHDYEVARGAAYAGLVQFEGMHHLAPENEDALFLLTKTWTSVGFAFVEDDMEQAEDTDGPDSAAAQYHKARAFAAYDRAVHYGLEMLGNRAGGFEGAKKNDDTMKAWLKNFDEPERDAANLFWTGYAWIGRVNIQKEDPAMVADLFIGVAMMEHAVKLDDRFMYGSGHTILGAYHARSPMAEMDEAKKEFDKAIAISEGKMLLPKFQLAAKYYCFKGEKENYVKTLTEVVEAGDVFPAQRMSNTIAKRRAKRYLGKDRMMRMCGF
jgi:hypothetical protein